MSLVSRLCTSFRKDNLTQHKFLMTIKKLEITTESYAIDFIDKKADQYQIVIFMLDRGRDKVLKLGDKN